MFRFASTPNPFKRTLIAAAVVGAIGLAAFDASASADLSVNDTAAQAGRRSTSIPFVVTRSGDTSFPVSVEYATQDGTAKAGRDYTATSGKLDFAAGQTSLAVNVPLSGKLTLNPKTFTLNLSNPVATPAAGPNYSAAGVATVGSNFNVAGAVADFNGDGKPDVAVGSSSGGTHLLRNDTADGATTASFSAAGTLTVGTAPNQLIVVDINRDGKPDLVAADDGSSSLSVYINTTPVGSPTLSFVGTKVTPPFTSTDFPVGAGGVAVADFDGDGILDLVMASSGGSGQPSRAYVFRNTTPVGATAPVLTQAAKLPSSPSTSNAYAYRVGALDVNGDGKPDITISNLATGEVSILMNTTPTGSAMSFAPPVVAYLTGGSTGIEIADVNGDGKPDIVTADNGASGLGSAGTIALNTTAKGSATPSFTVGSFAAGSPFTLTVADMNGDGKPDMVVPALAADSEQNGAIAVYTNLTAPGAAVPSFLKSFSVTFGDEPHFVSVGDFNHDGVPDFVSSDFNSSATLASFFFGQKPIANPQAKIVDASGTATLTSRKAD